jgi:hypothetical protein
MQRFRPISAEQPQPRLRPRTGRRSYSAYRGSTSDWLTRVSTVALIDALFAAL